MGEMKLIMKLNSFLKFVSFSLVFTLLLTSINVSVSSGKVAAATNKNGNYTEDDVDELANVLEVFFEKGVIYDEDGTPKGYDRDILKKELSESEYSSLIDYLEDENVLFDSDNESNFTYEELDFSDLPKLRAAGKTPKEAYVDNCIVDELNNAFGLAAVTGVVQAIKEKSFKKAAKKLLKSGVKGVGVPVTLGWILSTCLVKADKKYGIKG